MIVGDEILDGKGLEILKSKITTLNSIPRLDPMLFGPVEIPDSGK